MLIKDMVFRQMGLPKFIRKDSYMETSERELFVSYFGPDFPKHRSSLEFFDRFLSSR